MDKNNIVKGDRRITPSFGLGDIAVTRPDDIHHMSSQGGSGYHVLGKFAGRRVIRKKPQMQEDHTN